MSNPFEPKKTLKLFSKPKIEVYIDRAFEWRWRIVAGNNEPIGASSEGFDSKQGCLNNLKLVANAMLAYYESEKESK